MLYDIIVLVIISLILIILIHYLFIFFKDTLTVPKIKDLFDEPQEKYKNIIKILNEENIENKVNVKEETTNISDLKQPIAQKSTNDVNDMKNELKNFFNDLKQNGNVPINNLNNQLTNNFTNNLDTKLYTELR